MTNAEMQAELERLKAENETLRKAKARTERITLKVSGKGGVSVYGMGRFPVTLYREQWERLIAAMPSITVFIADNASLLKAKGDATAEPPVAAPVEAGK